MQAQHSFLKLSKCNVSLLLNVENYEISSPHLFSSKDGKMWTEVPWWMPIFLWIVTRTFRWMLIFLWSMTRTSGWMLTFVWNVTRAFGWMFIFIWSVTRAFRWMLIFLWSMTRALKWKFISSEVWREYFEECSFSSEVWRELLVSINQPLSTVGFPLLMTREAWRQWVGSCVTESRAFSRACRGGWCFQSRQENFLSL